MTLLWKINDKIKHMQTVSVNMVYKQLYELIYEILFIPVSFGITESRKDDIEFYRVRKEVSSNCSSKSPSGPKST